MMTMAQHHQQQPQYHSRSGTQASDHPVSTKILAHQQPVRKISTHSGSTESQQLEQDGKRTLIKNQLYLIEQLQLENANLRNERDQLQLENEELKFQLQMISSSNILSQPSAKYNDHQLERLVSSGNMKVNGDDRTTAQTTVTPAVSRNCSNTTTQVTSGTSANPSQQVRILATPLRQPAKLINDCPTNSGAIDLALDSSDRATSSTSIATYIDGKLQQPMIATATATKTLGAKSTSLASFHVRPNSAAATDANRNLNIAFMNDDEEQRARLLERIYGDSEKVRGAAIIIQRAFRKYQICKRFRTITEQLRHTCQSSDKKRPQDQTDARSEGQLRALKNVPYASGATRAAAWESLSYAASRLTANAAASMRQQQPSSLTSGLAKQVPSQQPVIVSGQKATNKSEQQTKQDSVFAAAINFQQLESIRKRQYRVGLNIFNKNPEKGVSFLVAYSFIDSSPKNSTGFYHSNQMHFIDKHNLVQLQQPMLNIQACQLCCEEDNLKRNVAHFLLHRKGLAKEKIGQYLGNLQSQFNQDVLKYYLVELDFYSLQIDLALRKFLSTFRLPGEAQKIERIVDCFAQRYVQCQQQQISSGNAFNGNNVPIQLQTHQTPLNGATHNNVSNRQLLTQIQQQQNDGPGHKNNLILLSKDEIFILTFAIIMLNTDLHSPSLKSSSRMSAMQFVNNLRGVFNSQTIHESDLIEIYERVKANQITTTPDHVSHVMKVQQSLTVTNFQKKELPNLCVPHRRLVCSCRLFEVYDINKKERIGQHQREIFLFNDLLLVTKLARRVRANASQSYTYRHSIPLQGLYVQLFQTQHYNYGIRLCQRSNDEILIMFNARNELDQSRFIGDLGESIAEMNEMDAIKAHNIIETIHFKYLDRLRRHAMIHSPNSNFQSGDQHAEDNPTNKLLTNTMNNCDTRNPSNNQIIGFRGQRDGNMLPSTSASTSRDDMDARRGKFNSMMNLSSVAEGKNDSSGSSDCDNKPKGMRQNQSFVQSGAQSIIEQPKQRIDTRAQRAVGPQRRGSTGSVHSLDSGLFLSRDVSPNQSS